MKRCPITYQEFTSEGRYSKEGIRKLSRNLKFLKDFPYDAREQIAQSRKLLKKMSIQGVQPKLSVRLATGKGIFEIVARKGTFLIKPQHPSYPELPENEDLTMRLAKEAGINVPLHGLIYSADNSLSYFIKRFDRLSRGKKRAQEDFAQLTNSSRDTKYDSSMENVIEVINKNCTFPAIEKVKLFRRTLFSFLVGNEDMHLKNLSLTDSDGKIELTPAYDLLNSTVYYSSAAEELALPLKGKKRNLTNNDFLKYFGQERLKLNDAVIDSVLSDLEVAGKEWEKLIAHSFLSGEMKSKYLSLISERRAKLFP